MAKYKRKVVQLRAKNDVEALAKAEQRIKDLESKIVNISAEIIEVS